MTMKQHIQLLCPLFTVLEWTLPWIASEQTSNYHEKNQAQDADAQ